jgi:hypothetical protein
VTPLYKALSTDFKGKMEFYAVKDSEDIADLKAQLGGITTAPAVVVWLGKDRDPIRHGGAPRIVLVETVGLPSSRFAQIR